MASNRKRILLCDPVSFEDMLDFSGPSHWFFQNQQRANARQLFDVYTWKANDLKTVINYVRDEVMDLYFVVIAGPDVDEVEKQIRAGFAIYDEDQIRREARETTEHEARMEAIQRLMIIAPQDYDAADYELFEQALSDPDPEIRGVGILATGYVEWPQLREKLTDLKAHDPDKTIRDAAGRMLKAMARTEAERKKKEAATAS